MTSSKKIISLLAQTYRQQETPDNLTEDLMTRLNVETGRLAKKKKHKRWLITAFSTGIPLFLVGLIFLNSQVRAFAAELPFLGPVVQLITGEKYTAKDQKASVEVKVPKITENTPATEMLNEKYLTEGKEAYQTAVAEFGDVKSGNFAVRADYQKIVDDARFLVIKRQVTQTAADSATTNHFDTIDKKADVVLSLPLLFKNDQYLKVITKEIENQMKSQMKASEDVRYWTKADVEAGDIEAFQLMTPDRDFYLNAKHQLVIVFPEFEIAPGYMGSPEFVIPTKVIQDQLVNPNYLD